MVGENRDDVVVEHHHALRISFVGDDPPSQTAQSESTAVFHESSVKGRNSTVSILSELDGSDDEDEMAGWFGPQREDNP